MRGKNTLVINGKVYDATTGLPVAAPDKIPAPVTASAPTVSVHEAITTAPLRATKARSPHHAASAHRVTHKSATLRRDVLKKPTVTAHPGALRRKAQTGHVAKSESISRFAAHPQPLQRSHSAARTQLADISSAPTARTASIIGQKHAMVAKPTAQAKPVLSSRALKEQLIAERLAGVETTPARSHKTESTKRSFFSKQPRIANVIAASFAVMVLGGYLTYLNMPGLSVRVAASQADVAATFPDYHPDGYRFNGPVAFAPGQVSIGFQANGGTHGYTVTEQKSSWDSQAVYDNVVASKAGDTYTTNSQQGLTIYTFEGGAAWVNKGILYTVDGNAPLNNEQLLRIASSL